MIPKIIYTTWVSPLPYPDEYYGFLKEWKEKMPDYDIRIIDLENIPKHPFVIEAINRGKYALAGHYGRCLSLYETGGLYFDIDIQAVRSFDDLLGQSFLGREDAGVVNNAVIGMEKGHPMMKACLVYMDEIDMNTPDIELETGPRMFNTLYKYFPDVKIYPEAYFYPFHYTQKFTPECVKPETYAIHWWGHTWKDQ